MLALGLLASPAQNLVVNGGFESSGGSFTGWNVVNNSTFLTADDGSSSLFLPCSGNDYALFAGSGDTIDQTIATTIGGTYEINYWVNDKYAGNDLQVSWNGRRISELPATYGSGHANNGWMDFDFLEQATSSTTQLGFRDVTGGALGIDAVAVGAVPEPGAWVTCAATMLLLASLWHRHRRVPASVA